jgi:hypothetical protein
MKMAAKYGNKDIRKTEQLAKHVGLMKMAAK